MYPEIDQRPHMLSHLWELTQQSDEFIRLDCDFQNYLVGYFQSYLVRGGYRPLHIDAKHWHFGLINPYPLVRDSSYLEHRLSTGGARAHRGS